MPEEEVIEATTEEILEIFEPSNPSTRVDVPGKPGCWVEIRRLGQYASDRYRCERQWLRFTQDSIQAGGADVKPNDAATNEALVLDTLVDWCFLVTKETPQGPTQEEMRAPKGRDADRARRGMLRALYRDESPVGGLRFRPAFCRWLVDQCKAVNGFGGDDLGNLLAGGAGSST